METLNFNDKRYVVVRALKFESIEDDAEAILYRNYIHAETILKRNEHYFFCDEIVDAEIIEGQTPPKPIETPK